MAPAGAEPGASRAGTVTTSEDAEDSSHLTRLQRYSYAAGAVGVWGPLVAFSALRSTIYVIYLGAVRVPVCVLFSQVCARASACARACARMLCTCTCAPCIRDGAL